jgi:hypothetical protein
MTIAPERLAELIAECDEAAKSLKNAGDEAETIGKFMTRETSWARSRKFADTAEALRDYQRLRGMTSAEAGESELRSFATMVRNHPDVPQGVRNVAGQVLDDNPPQGSECKTCKGTKVIGNGGSMSYGEFITLPCPDCSERKAVVEGLRRVRNAVDAARYVPILLSASSVADVDRAIALLSQEGLSDEQREACKAGAAYMSQISARYYPNGSETKAKLDSHVSALRQLASKP